MSRKHLGIVAVVVVGLAAVAGALTGRAYFRHEQPAPTHKPEQSVRKAKFVPAIVVVNPNVTLERFGSLTLRRFTSAWSIRPTGHFTFRASAATATACKSLPKQPQSPRGANST